MIFGSPGVETLRRRRWQRELGETRSDVRGLGQVPEVIGGEIAALGDGSLQRIAVGVTTGVLIWVATRLLDRWFGLSRSK